MTTTWYVVGPLAVLATLVGAGVLVKPDLLHLLSPTTPDQPGDDDREASGDPEPHTGASEEWGAKLKAMRVDMKLHPGFAEEAEEMAAEDARYTAWIEECRDRLYLAEEHFAREYSRALEKFDESANATGQLYDVRELDALLAGAA